MAITLTILTWAVIGASGSVWMMWYARGPLGINEWWERALWLILGAISGPVWVMVWVVTEVARLYGVRRSRVRRAKFGP